MRLPLRCRAIPLCAPPSMAAAAVRLMMMLSRHLRMPCSAALPSPGCWNVHPYGRARPRVCLPSSSTPSRPICSRFWNRCLCSRCRQRSMSISHILIWNIIHIFWIISHESVDRLERLERNPHMRLLLSHARLAFRSKRLPRPANTLIC
jgi:hypothetical protein